MLVILGWCDKCRPQQMCPGPDENIRTCEVITIYHSTRNSGPDENIKTCEVTTRYITVQQEIIFV